YSTSRVLLHLLHVNIPNCLRKSRNRGTPLTRLRTEPLYTFIMQTALGGIRLVVRTSRCGRDNLGSTPRYRINFLQIFLEFGENGVNFRKRIQASESRHTVSSCAQT